MDKIEFLILRNLLNNEKYVRKVIPFIKSEYFEDANQKVIFEEILKFVQEYNQPAIQIYKNAGFEIIGISEGILSMNKKLKIEG